MKKLFKRIISICLVCVLVTGYCAMAGAEYVPENPVEHTAEGPLYRTSSSDNELNNRASRAIGDVLYDKTYYIGMISYRDQATDNGSYYERTKFVKYLTQSWARAESYTYAESYVVPMQFSGGITATIAGAVAINLGVHASYTEPARYGINIPADANRDSKLTACGDFLVQNMHVKQWRGGRLTLDNPTNTVYYPTGDTFLRVVYR